ncbi:SMC5-like protein [Coniochaeta ligniaria NRRL 30616]|uniref:Structural maintenance of chromosomes protein 5 n=1 Tax=Coniochaeta ligniaria NRRL 30616 TaxID=1408157 RepID=A0A1J7JNU1_9PEZI|nr:SMC5-like protein [Coniochaeta ligniaria NRRL 30616]
MDEDVVGDEQEDDEDEDVKPSGARRPRVNGQTDDDDYKPGAIRRVKLANFVTYEHAEFFPGPSLNMVLGPNGTGKSSLVCAICLGLGYPSKVLGRASAFGEFVKHGKNKAVIEIELQKRPRDRANHVITLRINREDNSRKFRINGKDAALKEVQKLNQELRIQIDNLCQFLPQDKVAEFAGLSPVDLLAKTLQAAAPPEMIIWQQELKELYKKQKEFQSSHNDDAAELARLENRQESLQADVERLRERQRISAEIDKLKDLCIVAEYNESRERYTVAKKELKDLARKKRRLEERFAPALAGVNAKEAYKNQIHAVLDTRKQILKSAEDEAEAIVGKSDATISKVQAIRIELEGNDNFLVAKRKEVADLKRKITHLKGLHTQQPKEFNAAEWNTQIREKEHEARDVENEMREVKDQARVLMAEGREKSNTLRKLESKLESLDSEEGRLRSQLERIFPDGAKGLDWLEQNKDKFEKEVFGPPMLTCSMKDDRYRDLVQSALQRDDFLCFVAQTAKDHKTLSHYLFKELGLSVSVRSSLAPYSEYRNPIPREELKSFGLDGYATDYIEGPEPVLAMLCGEKRLHSTALGLKEISEEAYQRIQQVDSIGQFAAGKTNYRVIRRREYGAHATSTRVRTIQQGQFWRDQPVDTAEKTELKQKIEQARAELKDLKARYAELDKEKTEALSAREHEIKETIAELRKAKGELQQEYNRWQALPDKIETLKNTLVQKAQEISELKEQKMELGRKLDKAVLLQARAALAHKEAVAGIRTAYQAVLEAQIRHIEAQSDYESLKAEHGDMKTQLDKCAADIVLAAQKEKAEKAAATKNREKVNNVIQNWDVDELREASADRTVETITADIRTQETRLGLIEALNPHALAEYEKRAAEIEKLRREKAQREAEASTLTAEVKELRDKWEPGVDKVVSRINRAFSHNFEQINCAGEVDVHKDEEDFERWAIEIKVRFREGETLQILDQHRQSGGERAVSTIFYLMSLQAMAQAPFRVVDEINQGMDPRNERMVHERMVEIACREHTSQYFLITPKLLTDLRYDERMKVHCIASGEHVPSYDERRKAGVDMLDFRKCAEIQRRAAAAYPSPEPFGADGQ